MTGAELLWYVTRASGLVSTVALTVVVVLGLLMSSQLYPRGRPRLLTEGLHRNITMLALVTLVVHIGSAVLDGYAPINVLDAVLPFASPYRRFWLGLGSLAFDLLLVLTVTSVARGRLGYPGWRRLHWLAYLCWPLAVVHGLGTGTDTKARWVLALTAACVAAVVAALGARLVRAAPAVGLRAALATVTVAAVVVLAVWTVTGPLQSNWTRRSGTPANLIGGHHAQGSAG